MKPLFKSLILCLAFIMFVNPINILAAIEKIDGLEYTITKINNPVIEKYIAQKYDLYELYFENRSNKTFSIPGYSIDLGLNYSTFEEIRSHYKDKSSKIISALNIAASFALGDIARSAARTAINSVGSFRNRNSSLSDDKIILSPAKTYILYPGDGLSLFVFAKKENGQSPSTIRFICHDEDTNINQVFINNHIELKEINAKNTVKENVIALPNSEQYE